MSMKCIPPQTPHLNGIVGRGISISLIFAPKQRLWLFVRRLGGSNVYSQSMFWGKNEKNIKNFLLKISFFFFYNLGKVWACFMLWFPMCSHTLQGWGDPHVDFIYGNQTYF